MASHRLGTAGKPKSHLMGLGARPVKAQRIDDFEEDRGGAVSSEGLSSSVEDDDDDEEEEEEEEEEGEKGKDSSSLKIQESTKISSPKHSATASSSSSSSSSSSISSDSEPEALSGYQDITFGALAAAQQSLSQASSTNPTTNPPTSKPTASYQPPRRPPGRSSKHAPQALTSKRPVGRSRTIIQPPVIEARDPRFSSLSAGALDASKLRQNYAFLTAYEDSEMAELKKALGKTKAADEKEALKRALGAMRNRRKADEDRARRDDVERSHRRREKELVEQGKKPFFLKRADVKEKVLTEKFEAMKSKDVKRTLERRARKKAQRQRRGMPDVRRGGEG